VDANANEDADPGVADGGGRGPVWEPAAARVRRRARRCFCVWAAWWLAWAWGGVARWWIDGMDEGEGLE
jgi:hypothetical protein